MTDVGLSWKSDRDSVLGEYPASELDMAWTL